TEEGSVALEGRAGVRLRSHHHHPQARETEPRAGVDRAVPVLLRLGRHQIKLDDLLRDPERVEEGGAGTERPPRPAARPPRHCPRAQGGRERSPARHAVVYREGRHGQGRRAAPPRAVRSHDGVKRAGRAPARPSGPTWPDSAIGPTGWVWPTRPTRGLPAPPGLRPTCPTMQQADG